MEAVKKRTLLKQLSPYLKGASFQLKWFTLLKFRKERPHWFRHQIRINSNFPPYPSQSFDRIVDIIKNGKRLPHTIDFAITSKCPYHCPHCSYGKRKKEEMGTQEILRLIEEIKELGTAIFGITGGEPLTRPDLETIIAACAPELSTILYTTGFQIDKQRIRALSKAKIDSVIVGIDSTDPKIQDAVRGEKGSLDFAKQALQLCHEEGIYTGINTIATRERILNGELERIYDFAWSLNVGELRLNFPIATGRWVRCQNNQLKAEELEMLRGIKRKLNRNRSGPIVSTLAEYETADFLGCNTGYQTLFIDSSGEICPCDFTPLSFGNVKEAHLKDIWTQMERYFPRPRAECLMREISHTIQSDFLPLSPEQSKTLVPQLTKDSPSPAIYKKLSKKN